MQSINNGFLSLRTIIPDGHDEKLSKAAVLQQTAQYVRQLEKDKLDLQQEIDALKANGFRPPSDPENVIPEVKKEEETGDGIIKSL